MLKDKQLNIILKTLEESIEHLNEYLDKNKNHLCTGEINKIIEELEAYKNATIEVECVIGNNELNEHMKIGGLTVLFPTK